MDSKLENALIWGLFVLGLVLRIILIFIGNIEYDENFTIKILDDCGMNWICLMKADPSVPPLQYLWFGLVSKFSGNNLLILRMTNGLLFWSVVYWLGGEICRKYFKFSRIFFSFLIVFSHYQIGYSSSAYVYAMMAFWTIISWGLISNETIRKKEWSKWLLLIVLMAGLTTHYSFCWVIGSFVLWTLFKNNREYRHISLLIITFCLSYFVLFKDVLYKGSNNFYVEANSQSLEHFWGIFGSIIFGGSGETKYYTFVPVLSIILILFIFFKNRNKKYYVISWWPWLCLLLNILVALGVMSGVIKIPVNQYRTFVPASIALMMLFSWYLGKIVEKKNFKNWVFVLTFFILFLYLNMKNFLGLLSYVEMDIQGKNAAKVVSQSSECHGPMEIKYYPTWLDLTFQYYLKEYSRDKCSIKKNDGYNWVKGKRWWLLISRYHIQQYYKDSPEVNINIKDECPKVISTWKGNNMDLYLCEGK